MFAHFGITDIFIVAGVISYLILQVKDFRPIRQLRQENRELQDQCDELIKRFESLQRDHDELASRYSTLEKSRDFQSSFDLSLRAIDEARASASASDAAILSALAVHGEEELKAWTQLQREIAANTAVLSTLAAGINAGALAASAPRRPRRVDPAA